MKLENRKSSSLLKNDTFWFVLLCAAAGLLLIWRSFYGVVPNDEMYYVGTTDRLFRGEKMLIDEWNPTQQMCSFLLLPIFALFRAVIGSNEGMVLAFRMVYVVFKILVAAYCYKKLRNRGKAVLLPLALYLLATPYNIGNMSYNTVGIGGFLLFCAALASDEKRTPFTCMCMGFFASMVVLSNPYAVLLYVLYGALCVGNTLLKKKKGEEAGDRLSIPTFLWVTLGAAMVAVAFTIFVFMRGTMEELMANLPHIISDQEHKQDYWYKAKRYFARFAKHYKYATYVNLLLCPVLLFDKKKKEHGSFYLLLSAASIIPYVIYHGFFSDYVSINLVLIPISYLGAISYFIAEKKDRAVFYGWFVPGILYSICVQYASNTGILAVSASFVLVSAAGLLLTAEALKQVREQEKGLLAKAGFFVAVAAIAIQLVSAVYCKINYVWADAPMRELTETVKRGPAKGLKTTTGFTDYYDAALRDLDTLALTEEDQLLVVGIDPWIYLYTEAGCGSWSTWQVNVEETLIDTYYEVHPEKYPNVVYCPNVGMEFVDQEFGQELLAEGFEVSQLELGIVFQK